MPASSTSSLAAATLLVLTRVAPTNGHMFQTKPVSRHFLHTKEFNSNGQYGDIEKHADAYNGGGAAVVKARQLDRTDPEVLKKYGDGSYWPMAYAFDLGEKCANGNYLENDDLAVSHGVCGDTPQSGDDNPYVYSTPNSEWDTLTDYTPGEIIDIDVIVTNYHWGHFEVFLCCTADLDDPLGVAKQSCFNKYPLDRDPSDSNNSPVDSAYPGRYYLNPPCMGEQNEVDQTRPELDGVLMDGTVNHMRYKLPNIECDHAILMMRYHSGRGCKSPGYDEFEPPSWPSACAPNKVDWISTSSHSCNSEDREWGNLFWNCADITITGSVSDQSAGAAPAPTPTPEAAPVPTPEAAPVPTPEVAPAPTPTPEAAPVPTPEAAPVPTPEAAPAPTEPDTKPVSAPTSVVGQPTTPDDADSSVGYSHEGCFADDAEDRVLGQKISSEDMSTAVCSEYCLAKQATYMATQFGDECWCSQEVDLAFARHTEDEESNFGLCDMMCEGNLDETCGGHDAFDLYKITGPMVSDSVEYEGCYLDDKEERLLQNEIKWQDNMTPDVCRDYCETFEGSHFYATQYGRECWCGASDDVEAYKKNGPGHCLMGCSGDPAVACGGYDSFSLFKYHD